MSWRALSIEQVRLSPEEKRAMQTIQRSEDIGAEILASVVREFVGTMQASGYPVATDDTIPDAVRIHVINRTRWLWLCEFPSLAQWQTEAREKLNTEAQEILRLISQRAFNVEAPTDASTPSANWNSENKLLMRTHPAPRPGVQNQAATNQYANPDGPEDETNTQ